MGPLAVPNRTTSTPPGSPPQGLLSSLFEKARFGRFLDRSYGGCMRLLPSQGHRWDRLPVPNRTACLSRTRPATPLGMLPQGSLLYPKNIDLEGFWIDRTGVYEVGGTVWDHLRDRRKPRQANASRHPSDREMPAGPPQKVETSSPGPWEQASRLEEGERHLPGPWDQASPPVMQGSCGY